MTSSKPHIAVVFNPVKMEQEKLAEVLEPLREEYDYADIQWFETSPDDDGTQAAKDAIASGAATVVASGGDGTVRVVAEQLRGTEIPLAIMPQGTGNLLARNLGLPLEDLESQGRAAFAGDDFRMDLGVAKIDYRGKNSEERVFLVLAGIGFDARMMNSTNDDLKKKFGWIAYLEAGMREMIANKSFRYHYQLNGGKRKPSVAYTVMIGNCGLMPGGMVLIPDAKMDDGELDIISLKPVGGPKILAWPKIMLAVAQKRFAKPTTQNADTQGKPGAEPVVYGTAKTLRLQMRQPQPLQLDGDGFDEAIGMTTTVDPGALLVRVLPEWKS